MNRKSFPRVGLPVIFMAAASAANAQVSSSNLTISGWLDIGISKVTESPVKLGDIGRSNLAFAGTEDLGGGLSAIFRLSTRFDIDTGAIENATAGAAVAKPYFKDESTVGFKGPFGTVRLGRALTPLWAEAWKFDPWYNFDRYASIQWFQFVPDFLSDPQSRDYARTNDTVFWDTPVIHGFSAHLSASLENKSTDFSRSLSSSFNYKSGPLALMLGAERNSQKDKAVFLGAAYSVAGIDFTGSYNWVRLNRAGLVFSSTWTDWVSASSPKDTRTSVNLNAAYTAGVQTFKFGVGHDFQGSTNYFNYIGSTFKKAGTNYSGPIDMASIGYVYSLSKRTSLFGDVSASRWKYADDNGHKTGTGLVLGISTSF